MLLIPADALHQLGQLAAPLALAPRIVDVGQDGLLVVLVGSQGYDGWLFFLVLVHALLLVYMRLPTNTSVYNVRQTRV